MAEVGEVLRGVDSKDFWGNLESVDNTNLRSVVDSLKNLSRKDGFDAHLVVVGGTVDPRRRGEPHKDIDLVLYSGDLAIENNPSLGVKNFDKFEGFLNEALGGLKWEKETIEPFWQDWDRSSDGSVTYKPKDGKPIEILPVRVDSLKGSFDEYLAGQNRPYSVIF